MPIRKLSNVTMYCWKAMAICCVKFTFTFVFLKVDLKDSSPCSVLTSAGAARRQIGRQYFEKMLEMCGLIDDPDCPKAGRQLRWRELRLRSLRKQFSVPFLLYATSQIHSLLSSRTASTVWHLVLLFPLRWSWMYSVLKQLVRRPRMRSSKIASSVDHLL